MAEQFDDSFRYEPIQMPPPEEEEPPSPREWWRNPWVPIILAFVLFIAALIIINYPKPPPAPPAVLLDIPALIGKTSLDVEAALGMPVEKRADSIEIDGTLRNGETFCYSTPYTCELFISAGMVTRISCYLPDSYDPAKYERWLPLFGFANPGNPGQQGKLGGRIIMRTWENHNGCDLFLSSLPNKTTLVAQMAGSSQ